MSPARQRAVTVARRAARLASLCTLALIVLGLAWEMHLAPLRPGGSLLALKVLPLSFAVVPLWQQRRRAHQWWSMLILLYVCEGAVRVVSDTGLARLLALAELLLATLGHAAILVHTRLSEHAPAAATPAAAAPRDASNP